MKAPARKVQIRDLDVSLIDDLRNRIRKKNGRKYSRGEMVETVLQAMKAVTDKTGNANLAEWITKITTEKKGKK